MPASRVLRTFVPNKSFGQLLNVLLTNHISSKIFDLKFSHIEVWFTYQDSLPLDIEEKITLTLVINNKGV